METEMFRAFDHWRERRRNRATYHQLSRLSDSLLSDVGLTRSEVEDLRRGRGPAGHREVLGS
jgi:uncharacterized protein YjiS (DUF1127 family)